MASAAPQPLQIEERNDTKASKTGGAEPPKNEAQKVELPPSEEAIDRAKFDLAVPESGLKDEDDPTMAVFERWLLDNGAKFPLLHMRKYDTEVRGVHARTDIDKDIIVIEVPLRCLITVEMGKETDVGRAVVAADLDLDAPKHVFLMLFMLVDMKRPDSFFRPYYDILPRTLSNMPIFWSAEELRWLQGSFILTQVDERKEAIETDYQVEAVKEAICEVFPSFVEVSTLEEFMWARMCVCSRNFGLIVDGLRTSALVPYADMLNHYRPRETKWAYDNDRGAFTITTLQTIRGGAQIYDSYGQKCNHRFLLNYGFAIEENVEQNGYCPNEIPVEIRLDPDEPLHARKWIFWQLDDAPALRRVRVSVCDCDNEAPRTVLSLLRVVVANDADMAAIEAGSKHVYRSAKDIRFPIAVRNEAAAMAALRVMAQAALARYPTTMEEDAHALKTGDLPPFSNRRHALIQVYGEKVVWRHYLELAETALRCLAAPTDAVAAEACEGRHKHIADFCNNVVGQLRRQERFKVRVGSQGRSSMPAGPTIV